MFDLSRAIAQVLSIGVVIIIGWAIFSFAKRKKKNKNYFGNGISE